MIRTIKLDSQRVYALAIVYMFSFVGFLNLINSLLNIIGLQTVLDTAVLYGLMIALIVLGIVMFWRDSRNVPIDVFTVIIFFSVVYLISYLFFEKNRAYLFTSFTDYDDNPLYLLFFYSLPGYIFVRKLTDYKFFYKILVVSSYIIVVMSIVVFFSDGEVHGKQYMTFSYNMLLQLFVLLYYRPKRFKVLHLSLIVIGIGVFVLGGSRGALVSFVVAVFLFYIQKMQLNRKIIVRMIIVALLVTLYVVFHKQVMILIVDIMDALSIKSRNFEYLVQNIFFDDSHRMRMYKRSLEQINFFGYGLKGDRVFLEGSYVHNLFIELLIDFGWIMGISVIALLLFLLSVGIKNKNQQEHFFVIMLIANGFFGLLVSGSYLNQTPAFFMLFGFCVNSLLRKNQYIVQLGD